jgi:hypothetical protein
MDEREADYLRQLIRELERAKNRWKAATLVLIAALVLFLVLGTGTTLLYGLFVGRTEAMRARDAEMQARQQAEEAEMRARQAEMQAQAALEQGATNKNATPKTGAHGSEKEGSKR